MLGIIERKGQQSHTNEETRYMDHEQVDLLNKILKLESDL
jgi:hypothetical protein